MLRGAKTLRTLEEGFGQKSGKVLLTKVKIYIFGMVLLSVENKSPINT